MGTGASSTASQHWSGLVSDEGQCLIRHEGARIDAWHAGACGTNPLFWCGVRRHRGSPTREQLPPLVPCLRGDYDGDEINLHLPQGPHVTSELQHLLSVSEQVVTAQSGGPVVRLIQDAVAVLFWLTHIQPETYCPRELATVAFQQIAADMDVPSVLERLAQVRRSWTEQVPHDHPTKRAMAASGTDYMSTGYAIMSLCLPERCVFSGPEPATARLVSMYRVARHLPASLIPLDVQYGVFLGGMITADTVTGSRGLLNHIWQNHGPAEGLAFLSRVQRLTTSASLVGYCPSVGLDHCLLPEAVRTTAREMMAQAVCRYTAGVSAGPSRLPYRVDDEGSVYHTVGRLVQLRAESEAFVTRYVMGSRTSKGGTAASPARLNQIALLAMLATKGSVSNLIQCSHGLGQQIVSDSRLPVADFGRVFPHDPKDPEPAVAAESQGLLWRDCFIQGLSPLSFFVHAIAGREALVEGATSTAQSGYAMRLGVKAMESTTTEYDHTVRDGKHIIQFQYNGTGLSPKYQAVAANAGAIADLSSALATWIAQ